jgi:hypothetical protein
MIYYHHMSTIIITPEYNSKIDHSKIDQIQTPKLKPTLFPSIAALSAWIRQIDPTVYSTLNAKPQSSDNEGSLIILDTSNLQSLIKPSGSKSSETKTKIDVKLLKYLIPILEKSNVLNETITNNETNFEVLKKQYLDLKALINDIDTSIKLAANTDVLDGLNQQLKALDSFYNFESIAINPIAEAVRNISSNSKWQTKTEVETLYSAIYSAFESLTNEGSQGFVKQLILNHVFSKYSTLINPQSTILQASMAIDSNLLDLITDFLQGGNVIDKELLNTIFSTQNELFGSTSNVLEYVFASRLSFIRHLIMAVKLKELDLDNLIVIKEYLMTELTSVDNPKSQELLISELANMELNEKECVQILNLLTSPSFLEAQIDRQALGSMYLKLKSINPESELIKSQTENLTKLQERLSSLNHQQMFELIANNDPELELLAWSILDPISNDQYDRLVASKIGFEVEYKQLSHVTHHSKNSLDQTHRQIVKSDHRTCIETLRMDVGVDWGGPLETRREYEYLEFNKDYTEDLIDTLDSIRISNIAENKNGIELNPIHLTFDSAKHNRPPIFMEGQKNRNNKDGYESRGHGTSPFASSANMAYTTAMMALVSSSNNTSEHQEIDILQSRDSKLGMLELSYIELLKDCDPRDFALLYINYINSRSSNNLLMLGYPSLEKMMLKVMSSSQAIIDYSKVLNVDEQFITIGDNVFYIGRNDAVASIDGQYKTFDRIFRFGESCYVCNQYYSTKTDDELDTFLIIKKDGSKFLKFSSDVEYTIQRKNNQKYIVIKDKNHINIYDENLELITDVEIDLTQRWNFKFLTDSSNEENSKLLIGVDDEIFIFPQSEIKNYRDYGIKCDYFTLNEDHYLNIEYTKDDVKSRIYPLSGFKVESIEDTLFDTQYSIIYNNNAHQIYYHEFISNKTFGPFEECEEVLSNSGYAFKLPNGNTVLYDQFGPINNQEYLDCDYSSDNFVILTHLDGTLEVMSLNFKSIITNVSQVLKASNGYYVLKDSTLSMVNRTNAINTDLSITDVKNIEVVEDLYVLENIDGRKGYLDRSKIEDFQWVDNIEVLNQVYYIQTIGDKKILVDSFYKSQYEFMEGEIILEGEIVIHKLPNGKQKILWSINGQEEWNLTREFDSYEIKQNGSHHHIIHYNKDKGVYGLTQLYRGQTTDYDIEAKSIEYDKAMNNFIVKEVDDTFSLYSSKYRLLESGYEDVTKPRIDSLIFSKNNKKYLRTRYNSGSERFDSLEYVNQDTPFYLGLASNRIEILDEHGSLKLYITLENDYYVVYDANDLIVQSIPQLTLQQPNPNLNNNIYKEHDPINLNKKSNTLINNYNFLTTDAILKQIINQNKWDLDNKVY